MRVVLLDDVVNLGEAGSVVEVKNGYARNWLLPRGLAERATADALNRIGLIQRAAEAKRARRRSEAAEKFAQVNGKSLTITMKAGSAGRIFGSVTSATIVDEARKQLGVLIERRHIMLDEPIRHLGEFTVPLRAAADVLGEIKLTVVPDGPRRTIQRGRPTAAGTEEAAREPREGEETGGEAAEPEAEAAGAETAAAESVEGAAEPADAVPEAHEDLETQHAG